MKGIEMRKVTLWEMKPTEMIVGGGEIVRHHLDSYKAYPFSRDGEWAMPLDTTVQMERIPIHTISKMERGQRQDEYIAIEPRLREVLELPLRTQLEEAIGKHVREIGFAKTQVAILEGRISRFKKASWFVRIFIAIKADL